MSEDEDTGGTDAATTDAGGDGANGEADRDGEEGLTYADAGVDIAASEAATAALVNAVGGGGGVGGGDAYAGLLDIGDRYLGLTTDGVGTKLMVAAAVGDYSTIGVDCIAMNVNDLVAAGVRPVAFVDYLAVESPDEGVAEGVGQGLAAGADRAGVALVGGETAVMPEVVSGFDLAGTAAGLAPKDRGDGEGEDEGGVGVFPGEARPGDALVGFRSSGIHSNGLTLAREAVTRDGDYADPFPGEEYETVGEALLEPTRVYTHLLDPLRDRGAHAAAHVTGGGWTNLERMGGFRYEVDDPFDPHPVFEFVRRAGGVSAEEMHRTFNMGTGFVAALAPEDADALVAETEGRVIGQVTEADEPGVSIRGLDL